MTSKQALSFVKTNGIVLESGHGPIPGLAQTIAGEAIRGSWWAHPKGPVIFLCSRAIRKSKDVLVCRLVGGKVTYGGTNRMAESQGKELHCYTRRPTIVAER